MIAGSNHRFCGKRCQLKTQVSLNIFISFLLAWSTRTNCLTLEMLITEFFFYHGNTFWKQQQKLGIYWHYWPHDWFHCKLHPTWRFLTTWKIYLERFDLFYILRVDFKCTRSSKVCWFNKLFASMIPWKCYKMIAVEKVYQNSNSEAMKPTH